MGNYESSTKLVCVGNPRRNRSPSDRQRPALAPDRLPEGKAPARPAAGDQAHPGAYVSDAWDASNDRLLSAIAYNKSGTELLGRTYAYLNGANDSALTQQSVLTYPGDNISDTSNYTYDAQNRLLTAVTTGTNPTYYAYTMDPAGNRTAEQWNTGGSTPNQGSFFDYNPGNQLTCDLNTAGSCGSSDRVDYVSDQAGNQIAINDNMASDENTLFGNTNGNQLAALTVPGGDPETIDTVAIGGAGQSDLTQLGGTTLQNSVLGLTAQTTGSGLNASSTYFARTTSGTLIDERTQKGLGSTTTYNPVIGADGSIIGLLTSTGTVAQSADYGPYGEDTKTTTSLAMPFAFQGGYLLPGGSPNSSSLSGNLYHFGNRLYDPTTGRFTQSDPIDQIGSISSEDAYTFAGNDPIDNQDPSGDCFVVSCSTYHAVGHVISSAAKGAVQGAAVGAVKGFIGSGFDPAGAAAGAAEGAAQGAITGAVSGAASDIAGPEAGDAVDDAGDVHDGVDLGNTLADAVGDDGD